MIVLHITDLHIDQPFGCNEALRTSYYEQYLSDALSIIAKHKVEALLITGDIVNLCKADNYGHAQKVIDYIADELKLTSAQVFLVNGNHDVPRESGDLTDFNRFIGKYSDQPVSENEGLYRIYNINSENAVLCLNSIGDNYDTGLPCKISPMVMDDIVLKIKGMEARNIVILSHHPANSFKVQQESMFDESPDWAPHHIWSDGGNLFNRLGHHTANKDKVYWFAGDIHKSELAILDSNQYTVTTGGLNCIDHTVDTCKCEPKEECKCKSKHSHINPQMRIVNLMEASSVLLEFKPSGHENRGLVGQWKEDINPRITNVSTQHDNTHRPISSTKPISTLENTNANELQPATSENPNLVEDVSTCISKFCLLGQQLEENLYNNVVEQNLYLNTFYRSKESITSLAWISITELFNNQSI
ncbi:metallophosphoesterase, partial [Vibrio splendidus]